MSEQQRQHQPAGILDPALAREMIAGTEASVRAQLRVSTGRLYLAWGLAWIAGYLAMFLGHRPGDRTAPWSLWILGAALAAAMAVTAAIVSRAGRGVGGESSVIGRLYGMAWMVAFIGGFALVGLLARRLHPEHGLLAALYALVPILIVGIIYAAGGAMARDITMAVLGAWICLVAGGAAALPLRAAYLVVAGLAGGAFLVAALLMFREQGRVRARAH